GLAGALEFLKRTRNELRMLRWVRVWKDRFQVIDVNHDSFEVRGVGYRDADIVPLLQNLNTAFNPETIHNETDAEYKEFGAGKRARGPHARVMGAIMSWGQAGAAHAFHVPALQPRRGPALRAGCLPCLRLHVRRRRDCGRHTVLRSRRDPHLHRPP